MTFTHSIMEIVSSATNQITPQEIREIIKKDHPEFYGTQSQIRNVTKGYYKDLDHAVLAQIYTAIRNHKLFLCDNNCKPMKVSLRINELTKSHDQVVLRRQSIQSDLSQPTNTAEFEHKIADILDNSERYHEAFYKADTFRGPSLYFHHRALETRQLPLSIKHLEFIYATLASWGMHRMGKKGSKMQSFEVFQHSIEFLQGLLVEAQRFDIRKMNDQDWATLKKIFEGLNIMASGTSLVGNSKVMHHILPNVVPPIDREYTLWYLLGNKTIKNDLESEWGLMKKIISGFFIPVVSNQEFESMAVCWISRRDKYPWDTSPMKVVDNLVIGSKKLLI